MDFSEITTLLTALPGSLIYHLTLAIIFALLFSLTQIYYDRNEEDEPRHWMIASGGVLLLQLLIMGISTLAWQEVLDGRVILPPLERAASMISLMTVGWAVIRTKVPSRIDGVVLLFIIFVSLGLIGTVTSLTLSGEPLAFNRTLADAVWGTAGTVLALLAFAIVSRVRPREWGMAMSGLGLLLLGNVLHIAWGAKDQSFAGFVRLAELCAYPLFTIMAVRILAGEKRELRKAKEIASLEDPLEVAAWQARAYPQLIEMMNAETREDLARAATLGIGTLLRAELCLLLTPPDSEGQFSIAAGYDLIREEWTGGASLTSEGCPVLYTALQRHRSLSLPATSHSPDLQTLRFTLRLERTGPALLVPLMAPEELGGGILLLSPYARRRWSAENREMLEALATPLGIRFQQLQRAESPDAHHEGASLSDALSKIQVLEQEKAELTEHLRALAEGEPWNEAENIVALMKMHEESQETIDSLEEELERHREMLSQRGEPSQSEDVERLTGELTSTLLELSEAKTRLVAYDQFRESTPELLPAASADIDVIASIAQEIRQPLASIQGYTDLLLGESVGLLGAMQRNFLDRVRSGIDRMDKLVNNLLQVTAIEGGTMEISARPVDLLRCIEKAVMQIRGTMREKNLALRMDFPDELPKIMGDEDALVQILFQVLNNASGASPDGEEVIMAARVQRGEEAEFLMLTISDAGEGVPPGDLSRVFQRMREMDNVHIQGLGDSGVGLSIVHALSEALGGRVWFDSEVGVGSTVTILLQLAEIQTPLGYQKT